EICIIISHDRAFLNNCVTKIFEIDEQKLNIFEGNYDDYIIGKQNWLEARAREMTLQEKKRKQLELLIIHAGRIANGKKRGRAIRAAKKRMEREVLSNEITEYKRVAVPSLSLDGTVHSAKKMLDVQNLSFSYAKETPILDDLSLTIFGKEKVWLFGPNGSGKTTFIKLLLGSLKPLNGSIIWGNNTTVGYFAQDQSHLDKDKTVQQFFIEQTGTPFEQSFSVLDRYLFSHDLKSYPIRSLSPGQRARLSFAIFTQKSYDFLILDEPTNHLDISTKEVIEEGLADFRGNILLISHDRYFVDAIGIDRAITIQNKHLIETAIEP
ncbi:MAG: ATP-binding cassette domain-containing protein, partial [Candidatus Dojkabacteria bacterium]|nr:ATP-binding cassette domain-containing protein [Candidatus Dojkabacteria bacterium]